MKILPVLFFKLLFMSSLQPSVAFDNNASVDTLRYNGEDGQQIWEKPNESRKIHESLHRNFAGLNDADPRFIQRSEIGSHEFEEMGLLDRIMHFGLYIFWRGLEVTIVFGFVIMVIFTTHVVFRILKDCVIFLTQCMRPEEYDQGYQ